MTDLRTSADAPDPKAALHTHRCNHITAAMTDSKGHQHISVNFGPWEPWRKEHHMKSGTVLHQLFKLHTKLQGEGRVNTRDS